MGTTVRALLFGAADPADVAGGAWSDALNAVPRLSAGARAATTGVFGSTLAGLLELDLGQLVVGGWRRHRALRAAAEHTAANPTATELVQLAAHRVVTGHRPYLELVVNGTTTTTVHFDLDLAFDIETLTATVRAGRLVGLQSGRCLVTAALATGGRELVAKQATIDLAASLPLGEGIALLEARSGA